MMKVTDFDRFLAEFKNTKYWADMAATVEDSPWHREANVAAHTEMVMQQFRENFMDKYTEVEQVIGLTALLFHDTGKPTAEETLEKKDGSGTYRRYAGHEQDSAVAFQQLYVSMPELQQLLPSYTARAVRWMIEHHLPYGLKHEEKRRGLAIGTREALAEAGASYDLFFDCLRSDAAGRVSDGHEQKLQDVEDWIAEFRTVDTQVNLEECDHTMFLLIGPSGSGKSTWILQRFGAGDSIISLDEMRIAFFRTSVDKEVQDPVEEYRQAWEYANEHKSLFNTFCTPKFTAAFETAKTGYGHVFIDLVNGSKKKRQQWVDLAKKYKFNVVAIEFWNTLDTLIDRQSTRGDKAVPAAAVRQHLYSTQAAWLGTEAAEVWVEIGS